MVEKKINLIKENRRVRDGIGADIVSNGVTYKTTAQGTLDFFGNFPCFHCLLLTGRRSSLRLKTPLFERGDRVALSELQSPSVESALHTPRIASL